MTVVACSEVHLARSRTALRRNRSNTGFEWTASDWWSSEPARHSPWSWPPRFFHDPQRGLKFVNAKREFQPHRPWILEDRILVLFDCFETDQHTGATGLDFGSSRFEVDGLPWRSNHHVLPRSSSVFCVMTLTYSVHRAALFAPSRARRSCSHCSTLRTS